MSGVTSISVDVHKLGYANKGVSGLLLRDDTLEKYQRFTFDEWPSGLYSTRNNTGSRSGGGVASAWAVMNYLGEEGYLRIVERILGTRDRFIDGINSIEGLEVFGTPHAYLVAFGSKSLDIYAVHDGMSDPGVEQQPHCRPRGHPPLLRLLAPRHCRAVPDRPGAGDCRGAGRPHHPPSRGGGVYAELGAAVI